MVLRIGFEPTSLSAGGLQPLELLVPDLLSRSMKIGGADRRRTGNLLDANQALFQLSYGPGSGTLGAIGHPVVII